MGKARKYPKPDRLLSLTIIKPNNPETSMRTCPFCKSSVGQNSTSCRICGFSLVRLLPLPILARRTLYRALSVLSVILGLSACAFTLIPSLYMKSVVLIIGSLTLAAFTLEKTWGKPDTMLIRFLAILGLALGLLGYICFMFVRSNVPGIGYSM
jgi:hypothetical protein